LNHIKDENIEVEIAESEFMDEIDNYFTILEDTRRMETKQGQRNSAEC